MDKREYVPVESVSPLDTELNVLVRTQIQILPHLKNLSLSPPSQLPLLPNRARQANAWPAPRRQSPPTRLESLKDRLSRWQLMFIIDGTTPKSSSSAGTDYGDST
jgi:hypothetical protein